MKSCHSAVYFFVVTLSYLFMFNYASYFGYSLYSTIPASRDMVFVVFVLLDNMPSRRDEKANSYQYQ
jgi:hypothetical protein